MGKAVMHATKGGASGGLGNHIDRVDGKEHSYKNADPERLHLNRELAQDKFTQISLPKAIEKRIEEGYTSKRKIRADTVKHVSLVLTGTHEDMTEIFKNPEKAEKWVEDNKKWVSNEFGAENIVRFSLHLDEKTPHIHAVVVPITADGRLSAKELLGDRIELSLKQDRYAAAMADYGLERGIKGSKAIHTNEGQYIGALLQIENNQGLEVPKMGIADRLNPEKYEEKVKTVLQKLKRDYSVTKHELERVKQYGGAETEKIKNLEGKLSYYETEYLNRVHKIGKGIDTEPQKEQFKKITKPVIEKAVRNIAEVEKQRNTHIERSYEVFKIAIKYAENPEEMKAIMLQKNTYLGIKKDDFGKKYITIKNKKIDFPKIPYLENTEKWKTQPKPTFAEFSISEKRKEIATQAIQDIKMTTFKAILSYAETKKELIDLTGKNGIKFAVNEDKSILSLYGKSFKIADIEKTLAKNTKSWEKIGLKPTFEAKTKVKSQSQGFGY